MPHMSSPSWEHMIILIEWLSAFFLAAEAIKLNNLNYLKERFVDALTLLLSKLGEGKGRANASLYSILEIVVGAIVSSVIGAIGVALVAGIVYGSFLLLLEDGTIGEWLRQLLNPRLDISLIIAQVLGVWLACTIIAVVGANCVFVVL